jgi:endoglucanase
MIITGFCLWFRQTNAQIPFTRGVNLTGWFQAGNAQQIQFTKFTRQDFENIKRLGCDVIRLPIELHYMIEDGTDYTLDPLFFTFLDSAVLWAEAVDIHLIFDNHTFEVLTNTDPAIEPMLVATWAQMAEHYKNSYDNLYYEVLNEPHGIEDAIWGTIQQHVIDTIRSIDTKHTIIVGGAGWNGVYNLNSLPEYTDDNLMYTFHFYSPMLFTHQGANFGDPSLESLSGVPFPYDPLRMPEFPEELAGTWVDSDYNSYHINGTVEKIKQLIDKAIDFQTTRNVPVFCGEFGVIISNSPRQDRLNWHDTVRTYFEDNTIPWTVWDYNNHFFEEDGNDLFEHDLDTMFLKALGLSVPAQTDYVMEADSSGFPIYTDFLAPGVFDGSYMMTGSHGFYSATYPNNDNYCAWWKGGEQHSAIGYNFKPDKDLSYLVDQGYAIDFFIRGFTPGTSLEIRFVDTKTDVPEDHPWRMSYTINDNLVTWDGNWQHVFVPLSEFTENGSWDSNEWYNPQGLYDWTAVDKFEIVAGYHPLDGDSIWFDNIYVNDPDTASVPDNDTIEIPEGTGDYDSGKSQLEIYPNPARDHLVVRCSGPEISEMKVNIFDLTGRKIISRVMNFNPPGNCTINIKLNDDKENSVKPGIYVCHISTSNGNSICGIITVL